tara:strand:- start:375 stop:1352 length:978 start_codon:yes stop_codon:yes gene_type:complete
MNYKDAGVDIEVGRSFIDSIASKIKSTHQPEVIGRFGGFNGMMKIPTGYENPILVSGTDGVGTKLILAQIAKTSEAHQTMGSDLVAMCVNDVITSGAEPLYFLDYIATGKIDKRVLGAVVEGIVKGCNVSGCSLLGGETAEMPRMYAESRYDLAGFCTGIVEENKIIDGSDIKPGYKIIGIESSGVHSNGYSLVNKLLGREEDVDFGRMPELLTPTINYAPVVKELLKSQPIMGMAHISGGGIPENLPRCLPQGLVHKVDYNSWPLQEIFYNIMVAARCSEEDMKNTFNMGIGFCVIVPPEEEDEVKMTITPYHECWTIGEVVLE